MPEANNNEPSHEYLLSVLESSRQKLLDLTRRNRLLNYRESGRDIAIIDEMADLVFEDLVLNGKALHLDFLQPELFPAQDLLTPSIPDRTLPATTKAENLEDRYRDNLLQTPFSEKELERRLRRLHQEHKTIIEETGGNCLFLVMGYLEWSESGQEGQLSRAPLLLVPVRLARQGLAGQATYPLMFDDGALDTNYSLVEKLRKDFDLNFPRLEEEEKPESYWTRVETAIGRKQPDGWRVAKEMSLGLFRFNKQVMWHDLDPTRWPNHAPLVDKKVLKRLLVGPREGEREPGQIETEYPQDGEGSVRNHAEITLIRDADTSQYSALIDALGCDTGLVIEGPPGTGKSQTITNLIATALSQGLSVLFVAEKMAALEVVHKRLDEAGLAPFCLELHGLKTNKKELLASIMQRIGYRAQQQPSLSTEEQQLTQARAELLAHSKALYECVGPEKLPLYAVIWRLERLRTELPDVIEDMVLDIDAQAEFGQFVATRNQLDDYGKEWGEISPEARVAWEGFKPQGFNPRHSADIATALEKVVAAVEQIERYLASFEKNAPPGSLESPRRLLQLIQIVPASTHKSIPAGTDSTLIKRIVDTGALNEFSALLTSIHQYLEQTVAINRIFDFSAAQAAEYARCLRSQSKLLSGVVLHPDVTIGQLPAQGQAFASVIKHLTGLADDSQMPLEVLQRIARTLEDYAALSRDITALIDAPAELSLHANPAHAKSSVKNYAKQAYEEHKALVVRREKLGAFTMKSLPSSHDFADALQVLKKNADSFLAFFKSDYRKSRKFFRSLLADKGVYSRDQNFMSLAQQMYDFLLLSESFRENLDYKSALGPLFAGMDTAWNKLVKVIDYAQKLKTRIGSENATKILSNWDEYLDRFTDAKLSITQRLESIKDFSVSHPFPPQLWQKPVSEISSTLSPWVERIQAADKQLNAAWCQTSTTLGNAQNAAKLYETTLQLEAEIETTPAFHSLLEGKWQKADTNLVNLHASRTWIEDMLSLPGMDITLLSWLFGEDGINTDLFTSLQLRIRPFQISWTSAVTTLNKQGKLNESAWLAVDNNGLATLKARLELAGNTVGYLQLIERWGTTTEMLRRQGFANLCDYVAANELKGIQCGKAFEYVLYNMLLKTKISSYPILANFSHTRYESIRGRFAELDKNITKLNARKIASRLANRAVLSGNGSGPVAGYSQKYLLVHEANKKSRHIPIRQLIRRSGEAIRALKPCFLMSPLSVAQYLAPGDIHFDLVVMDEASQLRPEDALGSIARASKAIIVGDPKQLPPTSFFDSGAANEDDPEELTVIDDTEAILDVCLKQFPYRRLRWHYRSEHESLIQFSNDQFRGGPVYSDSKPSFISDAAAVC